MNTPTAARKEDVDPAVSIGLLALLASLFVASLFYLGRYSVGDEFFDRPPLVKPQFLAEGTGR